MDPFLVIPTVKKSSLSSFFALENLFLTKTVEANVFPTGTHSLSSNAFFP